MIETGLGVLLALVAVVWRLGFESPEVEVDVWQYVTYTGVALLAVGLVRDVIVKLTHRGPPPRRAGEKLICFESTVGALLVASGLALLGAEVHRAFHPALASLALWGAFLLVVSGKTKDVVMVFRTEKNHANVIPW